MGYVVDRYCHELIADARSAFIASQLDGTNSFSFQTTGTGNIYKWIPFSAGSPAAGTVRIRVAVQAQGADFDYTLPTCATQYEGGFLPWAVPPQSPLAFELGPELTGALILAALPIFAAAFAMRISRGLS